MKKIILVIVLLIMSGIASWQFASAASEKKLAIGEVPPNEPEDMKRPRLIKVGDITFNIPFYYAEGGGIKEDGTGFDSAKLRNVYNGDCLRKVDGKCPEGYSHPDHPVLVLKVPEQGASPEQQAEDFNKIYAENCESPKKLAARYKLPESNRNMKRGSRCAKQFVYQGLILTFRFSTGYFPEEQFPQMVQHITTFLNKFRIPTSTTGQ